MMNLVIRYTLSSLVIAATLGAKLGAAKAKEDTYDMYMDGATRSPVPRINQTGPVSQSLYVYTDAKKQGIVLVNETHVFMPFSPLQAEFVRVNHALSEFDAGMVNIIGGPNLASPIGRDVTTGFGAKSHTLVYEGRWNQKQLDIPERPPEVDVQAKRVSQERNVILAELFSSYLAPQMVQASVDVHVHDGIFAYAASATNGTKVHEASTAKLRHRLASLNLQRDSKSPHPAYVS